MSFIVEKLGKWRQMELLQRNKFTVSFIPETVLYSKENLGSLLESYEYVYVKHDTTGQGRGIFKVFKEGNHIYFNGYSIQGKEVDGCVTRIDDFHRLLYPFERLEKPGGTYIVQQGISSNAQNGQPISIRVHIQKLRGKWIVGGMNGKVGDLASGIANINRGDKVYAVDEVVKTYMKMHWYKRKRVVKRLRKLAIKTAKVIELEVPCREYGIDFGITGNGKLVIFEVNTTPGISGFAGIADRVMWKRIVAIRKIQNEE